MDNLPTKLELFDAGWMKDGDLWISPYDGQLMNLQFARLEEARQREINQHNPDY